MNMFSALFYPRRTIRALQSWQGYARRLEDVLEEAGAAIVVREPTQLPEGDYSKPVVITAGPTFLDSGVFRMHYAITVSPQAKYVMIINCIIMPPQKVGR